MANFIGDQEEKVQVILRQPRQVEGLNVALGGPDRGNEALQGLAGPMLVFAEVGHPIIDFLLLGFDRR